MVLEEFVRQSSSDPTISAQVKLAVHLAEILQADDSCLGAVLLGSFASSSADRLSDIDLVAYCKAGTSSAVLTKLCDAAETGEVFYSFHGKHDDSSEFQKTIIFDFSSFELHVIEPNTRFRLRPPYVALVDKDAYLATRVAHVPPPSRSDQQPYLNGDNGLIWDLFNCIKWLRRGHHEVSKDFILKAAKAIQEARGCEV